MNIMYKKHTLLCSFLLASCAALINQNTYSSQRVPSSLVKKIIRSFCRNQKIQKNTPIIGEKSVADYKEVFERYTELQKAHNNNFNYIKPIPERLGNAPQVNCENCCAITTIPTGIIKSLSVTHSNDQIVSYTVPLATTEGCLVASINRGAKALSKSTVLSSSSEYVGITRAPGFQLNNAHDAYLLKNFIEEHSNEIKAVAAQTSNHLKVINYTIIIRGHYLFLRLAFDTDKAMGMNMATYASQAIAHYIKNSFYRPVDCVTLSSNLCTDKKPSLITAQYGRGHTVDLEIFVPKDVITNVLKTTVDKLYNTWYVKNKIGSEIGGLIGNNAHAANTVAALYAALGQDLGHIVEGSMSTLIMEKSTYNNQDGLCVKLHMPAVVVGILGGGTNLPGQQQMISLLRLEDVDMHPCKALAEIVGHCVMAGELSLMAALSTDDLVSSHQKARAINLEKNKRA